MVTRAILGTSNFAFTYYLEGRKLWRAVGRVWVWYWDGTNIVYQSRPEGATWPPAGGSWSAPQTVRLCDDRLNFGTWFDGTYFHYAYSQGNEDTLDSTVYYRRGLANADGSITWSAPEQTVRAHHNSYRRRRLFVCVDDEGHPWISWQRMLRTTTSTRYPYITTSTTTDGTWSTNSNYPIWLRDTLSSTFTSIVPMTTGRVMAFTGGGSYLYWRICSQTSTGSLTQLSGFQPDNRQLRHNSVSIGDVVYICYQYGLTGVRFQIYDGGWSAVTTPISTADRPGLLSIKDNSTLMLFWSESDIIRYKEYDITGPSWGSEKIFQDETADTQPYTILTASWDGGGFPFLNYATKAATPYDMIFAEWVPPYVDLHAQFFVNQWREDLPAAFFVNQWRENLPAEFVIRRTAAPLNLAASFEGQATEDLFASFVVRHSTTLNLPAEFDVGQDAEDLPAEFVVKQGSVDLLAYFESQGTESLPAEFVVSRSVPSALVLGPQNVATATYWALAWPFQRKVWYSAGRHWVFYEHDNQLRYVSSVDGMTWDGPTDIRSCTISYLFGTWVDDNGYLHYVYCRAGNGRTLKYRRGFLESDGTITWSAVEQDAAPSHAKEQFRPSICVDDAGYPWITYTREDTVRDYLDATMVTKSSTNDGTWTTAPNYPVEIYPPSAQEITTNITPIASGKAFVTRTGGNASRIRGWLCDDDGPGVSQIQELPTDVTGEYGITTIVSLGDTAWVAVDTDDGAYVAKYQDGNWVGVVQVDSAGTWPPSIFMVGDYIYVAWLQIEGGGAPNSWMHRISMDGGTTWGASGVLLYAPGGVSRGYYASFAPHLESPLGFAWLHPHPGLAIYFGWIDVISAPELICTFDVGQDVEDLEATFAIRRIGTPQNLHAAFELQISVDLLGEFVVNNSGSAELLGKFDVNQDSIDLPARFEVGQGSAELLGKFEAQAVAELLGKFEAQVTAELLGRFEVGQDSAELLAWFLIPRAYNFSSGMGISFDWWGSGGVDQNIDFEMWSLTGGWVGRFPDGPAEWRQVQLSWDDLTPVDLDGTRPDSSQIIGIYWTYHTPGVRRIDGIRAWMRQDLLCKVVIRHASASKLLGKFEAQATAELLGKFEAQATAELLGKFEVPQGFNNLLAKFEVMVDRITLIAEETLLAPTDEVSFSGLDLVTNKTYILTIGSKNVAGVSSYIRWAANDDLTSGSYRYRYTRNGSGATGGSDNRLLSIVGNNLRWWLEIRFQKTPDGRLVFLGLGALSAISAIDTLSGSYEVDLANLTKLTFMTETVGGARHNGFDTDSVFRLYGYVA